MRSTHLPSDAELIAFTLDRADRPAEPERFAELYERHARAVYRYAASRLGREAADDLTSETFLVAFSKRDRYDPAVPGALPWLLGIAIRLIRRHRREEVAGWRAVAAAENMGGEGTERSRHAPTVDLDARLDAEAHSLALVVAKLPKRDRDVLTLTAWSELDSAGIAEALGIPIGTVRSRLHRVRRILRTDLEASGPRSGGDAAPLVSAREMEDHHARADR